MIGQHISHFYIIRTLGSGGMGIVYEAQDTRLPRSVAIKVLKPALARSVDAIRRFKREARLASSLNHPNICTVLDVDEGDGVSFIAMELLRGSSLKSRLAQGPLPLAEALDIAVQIADALAIAHEQGIIHRDITPGNVFVTDTGLVKLLDFGLAKHFPVIEEDSQVTDDVTLTGAVPGTVHYMAPERFSIDGSVDYRCDLFSLGAIVYQMVTGARPFDISPRNALIAAIQEHPHVPIRRLAPYHPESLERIVDRLLAKRPDDRYQTAAALRGDLEKVRAATAAARTHSFGAGASSVAVLPFEIIGAADADTCQFRDGLVEEISRALSAVPELRVAPRTSTRALDGKGVREIGTALGVRLVVEGTVQRSSQLVRVTANLVDAASERALHPAIGLDRPFVETLAAQTHVAQEIFRAIAPRLGASGDGGRTPEPEAYHALKRGLHHWRSCFSGGWRRALEHLQYAIERDPEYADAHVAVANAYNFLGFYSLMKPALAFDVAARAASRALSLDATLASAHRELALAKFGGEWDWEGSEENFRRAIALDGAEPLARVHYSWLLILLGRDDAAFAEAQRGHALAPKSRLVAAARAQTLYIGGRFEEAIEIASECLQADPDYVFALHLRGLCFLVTGNERATEDLKRAAALAGRVPFYLGLLGRCYAQFGMRDEALAVVAELESMASHSYVSPHCYVFVYAGLGDRQQALEYQERAYEDGSSPFNYLSPSIRGLYALDPYHKKRLEQMRLIV